jgi:DNA-binding MarR family transcriptional regulator
MHSTESALQTLFMNTISGLKTSMKNIMKERQLSLSPMYFMILKNIHDTQNCTANYLADVTEKDKGQITRLVQELINQSFVTKMPNPTDKRSQFLELTPRGVQCYQELASADQAVLKEMRENISDEELKHFLTIGEKMLSNLNAINHKV